MQAAQATANTVVHTVKGANDAIVVVINTGSGLIVASLDGLATAAEETTQKIKS